MTLLKAQPHSGPIKCGAWSPNGRRIATGSTDRTVHVFDARTGVLELALDTGGHRSAVRGVCWSPAGDRVASASWDATAKIWDARTGVAVLTLAVSKDAKLVGCAYAPDGASIATAGADGRVRTWDARTGAPLRAFRVSSGGSRATTSNEIHAIRALAFGPDGSGDRLATTAGLWDVVAGRPIGAFGPHEGLGANKKTPTVRPRVVDCDFVVPPGRL
mmetsp:Transcript_24099/g.95675  ORF Transcript_24099/g.95675 Transcript_24099/m.95675 type:complete len:217 (-) Transcript_24099:185-835(-)